MKKLITLIAIIVSVCVNCNGQEIPIEETESVRKTREGQEWWREYNDKIFSALKNEDDTILYLRSFPKDIDLNLNDTTNFTIFKNDTILKLKWVTDKQDVMIIGTKEDYYNFFPK